MVPAFGRQSEGIWAEETDLPLPPKCIRALAVRNRFVSRNPQCDCSKVGRFWIELELADGREGSSKICTAVYTQPPNWKHTEGIGVPHGQDIEVEIWFAVHE